MASELQRALDRLAKAEANLLMAQHHLNGEAAEFAHDEVMSARFTVASLREEKH